jgi:hypothetical protein
MFPFIPVLMILATTLTSSFFLQTTKKIEVGRGCYNLKRFLGKTISVDISDLNITMNDLERPIQDMGFKILETTGSSNRTYYNWKETITDLFVQMKHPGMRGQPAAAIDIKLTSTVIENI